MITPVMRDLPSGAVTFLFSDIEGSTRLLAELGSDVYSDLLSEHRRIVRDAIGRHGGVEFATQGDSFCVAFTDPSAAVGAARDIQEGLTGGLTRVRIGIHTGTPAIVDGDYVGADLHLVARISSAGHGGQTLLSAATRHLLAGEFKDLGEHRLKDFDKPVRLYQAGPDRFPPLRTISNTNLPRPPSSFVGRERELKDLLTAFREGARLVTLTGPGGSGKTRLAIETAAELLPETPDGVFWVGLATLRDPSLVLPTIAQTIGADTDLTDHVAGKQMLLILDNLEQVVEAAADLSSLLTTCPSLRLLITSRERLRVTGEIDYPVPPLAESEAVELFCARARQPPDETITELCRCLDNLPLAVELAAARTSILSPGQILERLSQRLDLLRGGRDVDHRQQTLRGAIGWSHDLLSHDERRLFARLSVFRGGSTLDAAEQVCNADLDTLAALVDKSLVRHRGERFWMLETIRDYASERLDESDDIHDVRDRHAAHYLALAEEAEPHLRATPKEWLDRLDAEHDNIRAALDNLEASGQTQLVLELTGLLWRFWTRRGHLVEGHRRLIAALAVDPRPTSQRGRALIGAAAIAQWRGDVAGTVQHAEEAMTLHQELGDPWGLAFARYLTADGPAAERDWARARDIYEASVRSFLELGDDHHTLMARRAYAWMCGELGERERYVALTEENLRLARATGNQRYEALSLAALAGEARDEGRTQEALSMLEEAYRIHRDLGERVEITVVLARLARAVAAAGRADVAVRLLACSEEERERLGAGLESWVAEMNDGTRNSVRSVLDATEFDEAWERGRRLTPDDAVDLATAALA